MKPSGTVYFCLLAALAVGAVSGAPVWAAEAAAPPTTGVTIDGEYGPFLPTDVSQDGYKIDQLIHIMHWFMGALFVGWGVFFVYCLVRFRHRPGHRATYEPVKAKVSKWAEIGVAAFEAVLLLGLSMPIWAAVKNEPPTAEQNPVHIKVMGEQFAWQFHYPGPDGKFGRRAANLVDAALNPVGLDRSDPNAGDDIVVGEMHIPVDRPVIVDLTAKDVIHSFFIPVMRVKQDTIPGMSIPVWFTAKKTGTFEIACAQLCGNNHYSMRALLVIEPEEQYQAWLAEKSKPPEVFDEDDL